MSDYLSGSIYVLSIGLPQLAGVTMGINCAPLIVDFFYTAMQINEWLTSLKALLSIQCLVYSTIIADT